MSSVGSTTQPAFKVSVKALIVHDDQLLLIKRSLSSGYCRGVWEVPGGKVEAQMPLSLERDPLSETLLREIAEEIGNQAAQYIIVNNPTQPVYVRTFVHQETPFIQLVFTCQVNHPLNEFTDLIDLSHEHDNHTWMELSTIPNESARILPWIKQLAQTQPQVLYS